MPGRSVSNESLPTYGEHVTVARGIVEAYADIVWTDGARETVRGRALGWSKLHVLVDWYERPSWRHMVTWLPIADVRSVSEARDAAAAVPLTAG